MPRRAPGPKPRQKRSIYASTPFLIAPELFVFFSKASKYHILPYLEVDFHIFFTVGGRVLDNLSLLPIDPVHSLSPLA